MKNLTLKDIIYINDLTIKKHGGSPGIKNQLLIESSLNSGLGVASGSSGKLYII
jgi:death-on-curing protein